MARYTPIGLCRLCGKHGPLTKEHIPPEGAWSGRSYRVAVHRGLDVLDREQGQIYQRGFYDRVLCESCNKLTGSWYGREFTEWSKWGFRLLEGLGAQGETQIEAYSGYLVRITKQVISTMIAASADALTTARPDLAEFVLNPQSRASAGAIRLGMFLCPTPTGRTTGVAKAMKVGQPPHLLVEFAMPPFGYVLTLAGEPYDSRPVDISGFTELGFEERRVAELPFIPVLPTHEPFPGDYRSKNEIRRDFITNVLTERGSPDPVGEAMRILESGQGPSFLEAEGEDW